MGIIQSIINEKTAERRALLAKSEVLTKQINDLEASLLRFTVATAPKPAATATKSTKPDKTVKRATKGPKLDKNGRYKL